MAPDCTFSHLNFKRFAEKFSIFCYVLKKTGAAAAEECALWVVQLTMVNIKSLVMSTVQLLAGWVGLALSTAGLGLFPDFPVFSVVDEQTKHNVLRWSHRQPSRHDNAVGMWVIAELVFFCLLTSIAALLYCCCRRQQRRAHTRSGTWYVRYLR